MLVNYKAHSNFWAHRVVLLVGKVVFHAYRVVL